MSGNPRLVSLVRRIQWLRDYVRNLRAWGHQVVAASGPVEIWHVHDLTALAAVAPLIPAGIPIVYDAHELFLETGTALRLPRPIRWLLRNYERYLVAKASAVVTVNNGLAEVLKDRYAPKRIEVVHNCPHRWSPPESRPTHIRDAAGIPDRAFIVLYHGALSANRGIEQLIEVALQPGLEDVHLALLGFGEKRDEYVKTAANVAGEDRIHVLDPVPPAELLSWVASADLGAMPIQASTLNHYLSTPNKLFECVAAGLPVLTSNFPAMAMIVANAPLGTLGAVCEPQSVEAIATALRSIRALDPREMESMRSRCRAAAQDRWNWESESSRLTAVYSELAEQAPP